MWYVYGEGGGQFNNLKDARQCAKGFSTQGSELDGYGTPGEVNIWKDGTLFMTYNNGKLVYDGWTLKNYTYVVKDLSTLEDSQVTVNKKLKLDRVYTLSDGRSVLALKLVRSKDTSGMTTYDDNDTEIDIDVELELDKDTATNTDIDNNDDDNGSGGIKECLHMEIFKEAFKTSTQLNPNLFDNRTGEMYNEVRVRLCDIADLFVESILEDEVPIKVYDYWLVGSNAAYNYSPGSDIDVHIIVDIEGTHVNPYLLKLLYNYIKSSFNNKYDIMVKGHEVELYLEDIRASAVTNGIYSLKQGKWIRFPEKQEEREYNIEDLELYSIVYDRYINLRDEDVELFIDDLYVMRKESLAADGEFGDGNLVFKLFRNNGYIDDLKERKYKYKSQELTLEQLQVEEEKDSGRGSHRKRGNVSIRRDRQKSLVDKYVQVAVDTLNYYGSKSDMEIELLDSEIISTSDFMLDFEDAMHKRGIGYSIEDKQRFEIDGDKGTYFYLYIYIYRNTQ